MPGHFYLNFYVGRVNPNALICDRSRRGSSQSRRAHWFVWRFIQMHRGIRRLMTMHFDRFMTLRSLIGAFASTAGSSECNAGASESIAISRSIIAALLRRAILLPPAFAPLASCIHVRRYVVRLLSRNHRQSRSECTTMPILSKTVQKARVFSAC